MSKKFNTNIKELDKDFIKICFKENWLHIRHLETQRMTVFSALVAFFAVAIYNAEKFINSNDTIAATVLILISVCISVVALLLTVKWNRTFDSHMNKIKNIVKDYNTSYGMSYGRYIQYTDHEDESVVNRITSMPRTGNLFVTVYIMIMSFLAFRLVQIQSTFLRDTTQNIIELFKDSNLKAGLKIFGIIVLIPILFVFVRLVIYLIGKLTKSIISRSTVFLTKAEDHLINKRKSKGN